MRAILLAASCACLGASASAASETLSHQNHTDQTHSELQMQIDQIPTNGEFVVPAGVWPGGLVISKPMTLRCAEGAEITGNGAGSLIKVASVDVTIRDCRLTSWGADLTLLDSAIFVERHAHNVRIENNRLYGDGFGIWLDQCHYAKVYNNQIEGNLDVRSQDRGNGIHLFNTRHADIADNEVWHTRDGIYIDTSKQNILRGNRLHDLRYGVHYMYSYHNTVENNYTYNTRTGYALMQSKHLTVRNNRSEGDENYGILMNFITKSEISGNVVNHVAHGASPTGTAFIKGAEGKALFMYNSLYNTVTANVLSDSGIGVHITAGSEDNTFFNNSFLANQQQVKYVANRPQEWSDAGKGNYWSDYLGWDRDGDDIGDVPHEANDTMDKLLWKYPSARVLVNSPAVEALRWAQNMFPVLKSPGVTDSYPLMRAPVAQRQEGE